MRLDGLPKLINAHNTDDRVQTDCRHTTTTKCMANEWCLNGEQTRLPFVKVLRCTSKLGSSSISVVMVVVVVMNITITDQDGALHYTVPCTLRLHLVETKHYNRQQMMIWHKCTRNTRGVMAFDLVFYC